MTDGAVVMHSAKTLNATKPVNSISANPISPGFISGQLGAPRITAKTKV